MSDGIERVQVESLVSSHAQISLGRADLLQTGSNHRGVLKVLPSAKQKRQKMVMGDDTGSLTCFTYKKNMTEVIFKNAPGKREVTALALGGPKGDKDRIYVAYGQTIQGINKKKGAQFFLYNTVLNEDISSLFIEDLLIFTACEYSINTFQANKQGDAVEDLYFYQAPDKIHSMAIGSVTSLVGLNPILGCQDRYIRMLHEGDLYYEARVGGPVSEILVYDSPLPPKFTNGKIPKEYKSTAEFKQIIYGTENGIVGQYYLDRTNMRAGWVLGSSSSYQMGETMQDHRNRDEKKASVTALTTADLSLQGADDIVVGRDDGSIEVYGYDLMSPDSVPIFSTELNESITSLDKGHIAGTNSMDIVLSTYSGKVMTYTHEVKSSIAHIANRKPTGVSGLPSNLVTSSSSSSSSSSASSSTSTVSSSVPNKEELELNLRVLKVEVEKLQERVNKEKEKYSKLSQEVVAVEQQFNIKSSCQLVPEEACYLMTLEIEIPLDVVTIQSNVPIMLLDNDSNRAMVSKCPPDQKDGNELLCAFRIIENTNRMQVKFRTVEGQHGNLNAYVIPKLTPKTCQKAEFRIKPLSLHEKVLFSDIETDLKSRPLNSLTITGGFSLAEVHTWVAMCLPEVPARLTGENASLYFRSTFLKTLLHCEYERGRAIFRSDSVTTTSIIKEIVSREATNKKININISLDYKSDSVFTVLELLKPQLQHHFTLARKHSLIEALKEIATNETDTSYLTAEYQDIIKDAENISKEFKTAPRHLDFLRGIVTDLFVDKHKLQGRSAQSKVPSLLEILQSYSYDKLTQIFKD